jgi:hypothetical protein
LQSARWRPFDSRAPIYVSNASQTKRSALIESFVKLHYGIGYAYNRYLLSLLARRFGAQLPQRSAGRRSGST